MLLDIELRFIERLEPIYPAESGIGRRVRLLQSRKLVRAESAWGIGEWTEWQDVPLAMSTGHAADGERP